MSDNEPEAVEGIEPCYFPDCRTAAALCSTDGMRVDTNEEAQENGAAPTYWVECGWCLATGPCRDTPTKAVELHNTVARDMQDYRNELQSHYP